MYFQHHTISKQETRLYVPMFLNQLKIKGFANRQPLTSHDSVTPSGIMNFLYIMYTYHQLDMREKLCVKWYFTLCIRVD